MSDKADGPVARLRAHVICTGCSWKLNVDQVMAIAVEAQPPGTRSELEGNVGPEEFLRMLGPQICPNCGPLRTEIRGRRWRGIEDKRTARQAKNRRITVHGVPNG